MFLFQGGTLTIAGTFLLVMFAPRVVQEPTAKRIQSYVVSWQVLVFVVSAVFIICCL